MFTGNVTVVLTGIFKSCCGWGSAVIQHHCVLLLHQRLGAVWVLHEPLLAASEQLTAASVAHHFTLLLLQVSGGKHECTVKWKTSYSSSGSFNWTVLLVPVDWGCVGGIDFNWVDLLRTSARC